MKIEEAQVQNLQAATIRHLVEAGYTHESVVKTIVAGDFSLLVSQSQTLD